MSGETHINTVIRRINHLAGKSADGHMYEREKRAQKSHLASNGLYAACGLAAGVCM